MPPPGWAPSVTRTDSSPVSCAGLVPTARPGTVPRWVLGVPRGVGPPVLGPPCRLLAAVTGVARRAAVAAALAAASCFWMSYRISLPSCHATHQRGSGKDRAHETTSGDASSERSPQK